MGSGFHLAMRDLEIRGAGNILGAQQHGFIEEIGFDLYCRLVEEAVLELKDKESPARNAEIRIQTDLDLFIPESYIEEADLRVEVYKGIAEIDTIDGLDTISSEIEDRYGKYPQAIENLLDLAASRILLSELGAERLSLKNGDLNITFREGRSFSKSDFEGWRKRISGKMEFSSAAGFALKIKLEKSSGELVRKTLMSMLGRSRLKNYEHSAAG